MYDVDGNGSVDLTEMTGILRSLYKMMGPGGQKMRNSSVVMNEQPLINILTFWRNKQD